MNFRTRTLGSWIDGDHEGAKGADRTSGDGHLELRELREKADRKVHEFDAMPGR
jgi:hypothetical protein